MNYIVSEPNESNNERMDRVVSLNALTLDLVSALSGDRQLLEPEKMHIAELNRKRGEMFFSDLLFFVTHQYFPAQTARPLWNSILAHKYLLSASLHRNVKLVVAALDYLSNSTTHMKDVTLITETDVGNIIRLSQHDSLTGLFNHSQFYQRLNLQLRYYVRYGTLTSMLMLDIDDFKTFNDNHGHQAGDAILAALGTMLVESTRDVDMCCRYGGEEFAVILPSTDLPAAGMLAKRMQAQLLAAPEFSGVTLSAGAATSGKDTVTATELVKKADDSLYRAKANGKNQVVLSN
jgi:diguanylate cyclase (GGDEF)-like protein